MLTNFVDLLNLRPSFVVRDPAFLPTPEHKGEDAGADLKAYIEPWTDEAIAKIAKEVGNYLTTCEEQQAPAKTFLNGKEFEFSEKNLLDLTGTDAFDLLAPYVLKTFDVGFKIALPTSPALKPFVPVYEIVSRSGLAIKHNVTVVNQPGTVDAGYRDWVKVGLFNNSEHLHFFTHGARIAQGLYGLKVDQSLWSAGEVICEELPPAKRGEAGFGSTGVETK